MWLIVASGLYLYAFFETSVAGAPASVDALTHGQPWAGGVLRSVHRYASDGLVLTMLLHMARHWAFDRYRGFRWFSWVSGMVLLWLVYVAGINGYMLPWDRLAKFTVIATAEWFDWLPRFNGTLVRNFIFEENVNDRLCLAAVVHPHRRAARGARDPLGAHAARAAGAHFAAAAHHAGADGGADLPFRVETCSQSNPRILRSRLRLVLPAGTRIALPLDAGRGLAARGRGERAALSPALAAAEEARRRALHAGAARQPHRRGAPGRDAARRRPARGHRAALRLPQRRLRRVQGDAALRQRGLRRLPARRANRPRSAPPARSCPACARRARTSSWNTSPPPRRAPRRNGRGPRPWKACSASRPT